MAATPGTGNPVAAATTTPRSPAMSNLEWENAGVREAIEGVARSWLARGVDRFRPDAVRYLAEDGPGRQQHRPTPTHFSSTSPPPSGTSGRTRSIVGEAWADTRTIATYSGTPTVDAPYGDELPLTFDFRLASAIVSGVASGTARPIAGVLDAVARTYPPGTGDAPFLSNHDQQRVASQLGGDLARLRLAAGILLTLQGTPLIYGEELGLANGSGADDVCKRMPMPWDGTATGGFSAGPPWTSDADRCPANPCPRAAPLARDRQRRRGERRPELLAGALPGAHPRAQGIGGALARRHHPPRHQRPGRNRVPAIHGRRDGARRAQPRLAARRLLGPRQPGRGGGRSSPIPRDDRGRLARRLVGPLARARQRHLAARALTATRGGTEREFRWRWPVFQRLGMPRPSAEPEVPCVVAGR